MAVVKRRVRTAVIGHADPKLRVAFRWKRQSSTTSGRPLPRAGGHGRSRPTMSALPSTCPKLCLVQGGAQGRETERGKNGACRTDGGSQVPT